MTGREPSISQYRRPWQVSCSRQCHVNCPRSRVFSWARTTRGGKWSGKLRSPCEEAFWTFFDLWMNLAKVSENTQVLSPGLGEIACTGWFLDGHSQARENMKPPMESWVLNIWVCCKRWLKNPKVGHNSSFFRAFWGCHLFWDPFNFILSPFHLYATSSQLTDSIPHKDKESSQNDLTFYCPYSLS